jgi:hypothetical protein
MHPNVTYAQRKTNANIHIRTYMYTYTPIHTYTVERTGKPLENGTHKPTAENLSSSGGGAVPGKRLVRRKVKRTVRRPRPKSTIASPRECDQISRSLGVEPHRRAPFSNRAASPPMRGPSALTETEIEAEAKESAPSGKEKVGVSVSESESARVGETKARMSTPVATQYAEFKYCSGKYKGESAVDDQHPHGMGKIVFEVGQLCVLCV